MAFDRLTAFYLTITVVSYSIAIGNIYTLPIFYWPSVVFMAVILTGSTAASLLSLLVWHFYMRGELEFRWEPNELKITYIKGRVLDDEGERVRLVCMEMERGECVLCSRALCID